MMDRLSKKVAGDKDEMKRRRRIHVMKRKKSDAWSRKNTTHFIIDVVTRIRTLGGIKWYSRNDERKILLFYKM